MRNGAQPKGRLSALGQKHTSPSGADDARSTSKADIEATQTDVRFVPIADIGWLFDQLVSTSEQLAWYLEAKRPCRREIDEELKVGRLNDR